MLTVFHGSTEIVDAPVCANDRVIDTVNLYIQGLIDSTTALQQLAYYKPNNQICLLNQSLTDKYLHFYESERI